MGRASAQVHRICQRYVIFALALRRLKSRLTMLALTAPAVWRADVLMLAILLRPRYRSRKLHKIGKAFSVGTQHVPIVVAQTLS